MCSSIARRFGCGIDAELDEAGRTALAQLRGVTMRSIQRLAAELYGGNAHFLLELVQNADDNKYPADVVPQLGIEVSADGTEILFDNNEEGFSAENVSAWAAHSGSAVSTVCPACLAEAGACAPTRASIAWRPRGHRHAGLGREGVREPGELLRGESG